jgi:hypothetical protein
MTAGFRQVRYDPSDLTVQALINNGAAAVTSIGKYVVIAPNGVAVAAAKTALWDAAGSGAGTIPKAVAWVRGGAYARAFSVTVTDLLGTVTTVSYTTPTASYSGVLDTSGVSVFALDPAGGTQVDSEGVYAEVEGDPLGPRHKLNWGQWAPVTLTAKRGATAMTNTYPSLPTTAAQFYWAPGGAYVYLHAASNKDETPVTVSYTHNKVITNPVYTQVIGELTNAYNSAVTAWIASAALAIKAENIATKLKDLLVAAGVACTVDGSHILFDGVRAVTLSDGGDGTLARAVAHEVTSVDELSQRHWVGKVVRIRPGTGGDAFYMKATAKDSAATGFAEVVWVEGGAFSSQLSGGLVFGVSYNDQFCLASTSAYMQTLCGQDVPPFELGEVGDADTNPDPFFVGKQISYLGVFQDRMLVGANGVIRASRSSEYLTFYKRSILTTLADDAVELTSPGDEQDTIRYSVLYERNLVLFGDKQYIINGTVPLTPTNAVMQIMSAHKGTDTAQPAIAGSSIFYLKPGPSGTSVQQMQPGQYAETTESYQLTQQLSSYIPKGGVELLPIGEPDLLVVRSTGSTNNLYLFRYLDTPNGREQAAWFRFEYSTALGKIIGIAELDEGIVIIRAGDYLYADYQPFSTQFCPEPYLDARGYPVDGRGDVYAFGEGDNYGLGGTLAEANAIGNGYFRGTQFLSYVVMTPPYFRDQQGKANLNADLVVSSYGVQLANSGGAYAAVEGDTYSYYTPDVVGDDLIEKVRLADMRMSVPAFVENSYAALSLQARDWLPCNITSVDWVGQLYNRTQGIN